MNRPTELTVAYAKYIWSEEGFGLDELNNLKDVVFSWIDTAAEQADDESSMFFKTISGYALASVDWRAVEAEVEAIVKGRSSD